MSLQQRTRNLNITDQENVKRPGKLAAAVPKAVGTSRPALGDVGNKLQSQNVGLKKPGTIKVPAPFNKQPVQALPKKNIITKEKNLIVTNKPKTELIAKVDSTNNILQEEKNLNKPTGAIKPIGRILSEKKIEVEEKSGYSSKQLAGVIDVDANDQDDPFLVSEYIQDICGYLHDLEKKYTVRENFMQNHRSNAKMRTILVNWMVDVHVNFKLLLETLHLSVGLLDRYLQMNKSIGRETLQLVGTTAMIIAGKYEEIYMPEITDFAYICDNTYSRSEILRMEVEMLDKLKFNLGRPLSVHFLRRYSKIAAIQPEHHNLAKYLLEICLLEYELCHINPSVQAASACCLSMSILNEVLDPSEVWTQTLTHYTTYKYSDIKNVVRDLAYFLKKMESSKYQAVRSKYASSKLNKVSVLPELSGPLVQKLSLEVEKLKDNSDK